jgi:hypothetical protein
LREPFVELLIELLIVLLPLFELFDILLFDIELFIVELLIELVFEVVPPPDVLPLFDIELLFAVVEPLFDIVVLFAIDELLFIIEFEFVFFMFVFASLPHPKANIARPATPNINFLFI